MKKILIFLITICIVVIAFVGLKIQYNRYNISSFEPFSENNSLYKIETNIKIENNLPKIESASAFYPFSANLVQNIYSKDSYSKDLFQLVSTSQAFSDIIEGKTDIIIATEPSDEQKEQIKKSGVELEFEAIFLEPLVIFLNKNNTINNLNIEEIKKIYYDDSDNKFNTYQLEKNNGSQTCFESIVKNNKLGRNHYEIKTMPEIIDKVANDKKGIGYAFYSYYSKMHKNQGVKIINVNNKSIKENDYPLLFNVYFIYRKNNKNDNIYKILELLKTEQGKDFIKQIK